MYEKPSMSKCDTLLCMSSEDVCYPLALVYYPYLLSSNHLQSDVYIFRGHCGGF